MENTVKKNAILHESIGYPIRLRNCTIRFTTLSCINFLHTTYQLLLEKEITKTHALHFLNSRGTCVCTLKSCVYNYTLSYLVLPHESFIYYLLFFWIKWSLRLIKI